MALETRLQLLPDRPGSSSLITTGCRWCRVTYCKFRPETNLALMMCLVFYLYICLGGALFLLLEGHTDNFAQANADMTVLTKFHNISYVQLAKIARICQDMDGQRGKLRMQDSLWNFMEATDYAYQVLTGQGTGQTTRIIKTHGSKIAYIFFVLFGIPISLLTFRASGQRLNMLTYALIRFVNGKILQRQVTSNIHLKSLVFNLFLLLAMMFAGTALYAVTQRWSLIESLYFTTNVIFAIGNFESQIINKTQETNSERDKLLRVIFNLYSFAGFTVMSSFFWSAHHFTRHMRFRAHNRHVARTGDNRTQCPWLEVSRSNNASPNNRGVPENEPVRT